MFKIGDRFRDGFGTLHTIIGIGSTGILGIEVSECKNSNRPGTYDVSPDYLASRIGVTLFRVKD